MDRRKPNFIFILGDDWGWGDLGCFGHKQIKTPNLDKLAQRGTIFTQFYVASPVCSPSRAAFMTGYFPARHRIHRVFARPEHPEHNEQQGMPNFLDPNVTTITKLLQQNGYITAHFGKWHLGSSEGAPTPGKYGIDVHLASSGNGPQLEFEGVQVRDPAVRRKSTELIVDETIKFIEDNKDRSFYVQAWLLDPHAILNPDEEQMEPYVHLSPEGVNHKGAMTIYYSAITDADRHIGGLLRKLDELGLSENTVVIFTSDNGPEDIYVKNASHSGVGSPGPFRGRKRSLYNGGVRMPFIVRWPEHTPAGRVDNESVIGAVDFLPTVCSLAGIELPDNLELDGEDVSSVLTGHKKERTKSLMWEWRFNIIGHVINKSPMLAIRDGRWKLLMNPDSSRIELYDAVSDRMEINNVAEKHPEVVERLSSRVLEWQATLPKGPVSPGAGSNEYPWPGRD